MYNTGKHGDGRKSGAHRCHNSRRNNESKNVLKSVRNTVDNSSQLRVAFTHSPDKIVVKLRIVVAIQIKLRILFKQDSVYAVLQAGAHLRSEHACVPL